MLIRELEAKTGLERATIRFYEREGFVQPLRHENGYREYSAADCDNLLKIKLLRKIGISLERIRDLQQGREDFSAALDDQIEALEAQMQSAARAKDVCQKMQSAGVRYETLNAKYYLDLLEKPVQNNAKVYSPPVPEFHASMYIPKHPVRRLLARLIDMGLLSVLLRFLVFVTLRVRFFVQPIGLLLDVGSMFLSVPVNAFLLARFGTTPGKWVMGLSVFYCDGDRMVYHDAKDREWDVLRHGLGFCIPGWTYWRLYRSYKDYMESSGNEWDLDSEIIYEDWTNRRIVTMMLLMALSLGLSVFTGIDTVKPRYRGAELTISQFAANYNYTAASLNNGGFDYERLDSTGNWIIDTSGAVIYLNGEPDDPDAAFRYTTEGEYISSIQYKNTYRDVFAISVLPERCIIAAISVISAQKDVSLWELFDFTEKFDAALMNESGALQTENIIIRWNTEGYGSEFVNGQYFANGETENNFVTCEFEIEILK